MGSSGAHVVGRIGTRKADRRSNARRTVAQQDESISADCDLRAVRDLGALDARTIHVGPVLALEIDDHVAIVFQTQFRVSARHAFLRVGKYDVVVAAAANLQALVVDLEDLLDTFSADNS
jgi:hypothetical protein